MNFLSPMRPGISLPPLDEFTGELPPGWCYQCKVDDHRGMLSPGGTLYNRHGGLIADHKQRVFAPAIAEVRRLFPDQWVDLALMGYRTGTDHGKIVVLDLPDVAKGYVERWKIIQRPLPSWDSASSQLVCCLLLYDAAWAWKVAKRTPSSEGIIGRNPGSLYESGDSKNMLKSKWRKE